MRLGCSARCIELDSMSTIEQFGYRAQLARCLSTWDLVVYGMVVMVPIAPYAIFGFVWNDSKGMVPLAYLLGLVGMLFTAMSYALMSQAFPLAGSVYAYAARGLHQWAGFFAGWLILLDYILVPALVYVVSVVAMRSLVPAVPGWVWLVGFVAFNAIVNLLGIHFTAQLNRYMLMLELATLVLFLSLGSIALAAGKGAGGLTLRPIYDPAAFSLATVAGATSIAVLSFLGFDAISTLAEENQGAARNVGRATLLALLLVGALFILQTWIATDLARGMHFSSPANAFYEISERAGGHWLRVITVGAVVVSSGIGNAMAAQAAVARVLFAMARDGKLPAALGSIHPRFKTPYVSILLVAAISLIVGSVFSERLDDLSRIVNFGALTAFLLLHISVINYFWIRQRSRDWIRHLLFPVAGFLVIAYVLYSMDIMAKLLGASWIVIGVVYYLVLTRILKRPLALDL
jgi:amino acid transporter